MKTNNVTFGSKIKFINTKNFNKTLVSLKPVPEEVPYPWTIETSKLGTNLFTTSIMDCIAIILTNGKETLLAHLGIRNKKEAERDNVKEFDINNIEQNLSKKLNLQDKKLHGFIIGGMQIKDDPETGNTPQLNQLKSMFEKYKIPYSLIGARKDVHFFGRYSLFFNQDNDTLFITNNLFDSDGICGKCGYKELELVDDQKIKYNLYDFDNGYQKRRVETSIEDYFKSQFRQVKLNVLDKFE